MPHALRVAALAIVCLAVCLMAVVALRAYLLSPMDAYVPIHDGTGRIVGTTHTTIPSQ